MQPSHSNPKRSGPVALASSRTAELVLPTIQREREPRHVQYLLERLNQELSVKSADQAQETLQLLESIASPSTYLNYQIFMGKFNLKNLEPQADIEKCAYLALGAIKAHLNNPSILSIHDLNETREDQAIMTCNLASAFSRNKRPEFAKAVALQAFNLVNSFECDPAIKGIVQFKVAQHLRNDEDQFPLKQQTLEILEASWQSLCKSKAKEIPRYLLPAGLELILHFTNLRGQDSVLQSTWIALETISSCNRVALQGNPTLKGTFGQIFFELSSCYFERALFKESFNSAMCGAKLFYPSFPASKIASCSIRALVGAFYLEHKRYIPAYIEAFKFQVKQRNYKGLDCQSNSEERTKRFRDLLDMSDGVKAEIQRLGSAINQFGDKKLGASLQAAIKALNQNDFEIQPPTDLF